MREITGDEAFMMAGASECPVLKKEESEAMEAAVCLKRFPAGYVLGISDKIRNLRLFFTPELALAEGEYEKYVHVMRVFGSPFETWEARTAVNLGSCHRG